MFTVMYFVMTAMLRLFIRLSYNFVENWHNRLLFEMLELMRIVIDVQHN